MNEPFAKKVDWLLLPLVGIGVVLTIWAISSATWAKELPSPLKTWQTSKPYVLEPFAKRGEMDQGILRFTWYSLTLVAKGYTLALLIGTPIGFLLGLSKGFSKTFDPIIQVLRPVSPLAWLPLLRHQSRGKKFVTSYVNGVTPVVRCQMRWAFNDPPQRPRRKSTHLRQLCHVSIC